MVLNSEFSFSNQKLSLLSSIASHRKPSRIHADHSQNYEQPLHAQKAKVHSQIDEKNFIFSPPSALIQSFIINAAASVCHWLFPQDVPCIHSHDSHQSQSKFLVPFSFLQNSRAQYFCPNIDYQSFLHLHLYITISAAVPTWE